MLRHSEPVTTGNFVSGRERHSWYTSYRTINTSGGIDDKDQRRRTAGCACWHGQVHRRAPAEQFFEPVSEVMRPMSDGDIVQEFLVESAENRDRLDRDLVGLEQNPQDKAALAGIFRTIHTIKGTCGFLGFGKLEKVAHVGENLL